MCKGHICVTLQYYTHFISGSVSILLKVLYKHEGRACVRHKKYNHIANVVRQIGKTLKPVPDRPVQFIWP